MLAARAINDRYSPSGTSHIRPMRDTRCVKIVATTSLAIGNAENVSCHAEIRNGGEGREGGGKCKGQVGCK